MWRTKRKPSPRADLGWLAQFVGFERASNSEENAEPFEVWAPTSLNWDLERMEPVVDDAARALDRGSVTQFTEAVMRANVAGEACLSGA